MLQKLILLLIMGYGLSSNAQSLSTAKDSLSYSIGVVVAQNIKKEGIKNINAELMARAIEAVLLDKELLLSPSQSDSIFKVVVAKQQKMLQEMNKLDGENFLAENAKRPEITSLPSGLQYEIITEGDGANPEVTDKVRTHYHGTLIDGRVFDSSVERGEPISFPLNRVIQAWQEALPLMKVGSKWRIYSPQNLAYGAQQAGPLIKPFSALIFEIELLGIE